MRVRGVGGQDVYVGGWVDGGGGRGAGKWGGRGRFGVLKKQRPGDSLDMTLQVSAETLQEHSLNTLLVQETTDAAGSPAATHHIIITSNTTTL